ncbi:LPXTG cell wall anchor domain-containing protein [Comamonas sediminis]|uniref:LPXTG cell wall anchor domain-containing protein n=1 Tax=Comamonas sediminis TaxID=1783360 RepID=A0ABV4B3Y1_9BURK
MAAPTPVPATSLLGLLALSSLMGLAGVGSFFRRRS